MGWAKRLTIVLLAFILLAYTSAVGLFAYNQRALIYAAPADITPAPLGYQQVEFETADGLTLKAAWKEPEDGSPSVVYFHGTGGNWSGSAAATSKIAAAGYGVLLTEYRGYNGNPGSPDEEGLYLDGRAAMAWLEQAGISSDQVIVIGNSLGSGVATDIASEIPVKALILISPFTSLPDSGASLYPWLPVRWVVQDKYPNLDKIGDVVAPVLVMHGTSDRVIPFEHGEALAERAIKADLLSFPGVGHDLAFRNEGAAAVHDWVARLPN